MEYRKFDATVEFDGWYRKVVIEATLHEGYGWVPPKAIKIAIQGPLQFFVKNAKLPQDASFTEITAWLKTRGPIHTENPVYKVEE